MSGQTKYVPRRRYTYTYLRVAGNTSSKTPNLIIGNAPASPPQNFQQPSEIHCASEIHSSSLRPTPLVVVANPELERRKIETTEDTKISTYTHTKASKWSGEGGRDANACNTNNGKLPQRFIAAVCSAERPHDKQEHDLEERWAQTFSQPLSSLIPLILTSTFSCISEETFWLTKNWSKGIKYSGP